VVGVLSVASPEVGVATRVGVALTTLLVQIFTWTDGHDHDGGLPLPGPSGLEQLGDECDRGGDIRWRRIRVTIRVPDAQRVQCG
jgi:hypothetical protein